MGRRFCWAVDFPLSPGDTFGSLFYGYDMPVKPLYLLYAV